MKEKIKILILLVIFIILMIMCNIILNNPNMEQPNGGETITQEQVKYNEEEKDMNGNVLEITSENFEEEVLKSEKIVLVDFYADWCGPCKMLSPIVEEVAAEEKNVKFVKINIDNEQDIAINYQVISIPTLVVLKNGEEINRSVGLIDKNEVKDLIK